MPSTSSNTIQIIINPSGTPPSWQGTPTPIFDQGVGASGSYNITPFVASYSALTDTLSLDPASVAIGPGSLHPWLTFNGISLVPDGSQTGPSFNFSGIVFRLSRTGFSPVASASVSVIVNAQVITATWAKISSPASAFEGSFAAGSFGSAVEREAPGRLWCYFEFGGLYDPVTNQWGFKINKQRRENAYWDYDVTNHIFWSPPGCQINDPTMQGTVTYNPATNVMVEVLTPAQSIAGCDAGGGIDNIRKKAYTFGGFFPSGSPPSGKLASLDISNYPTLPVWVGMNPTGDTPQLFEAQGSTGYTHYKGGMDHRDGSLWVLGDDQELYWWYPGENRWKLLPALGTKPPTFCIAALDESRNIIIAQTGYNFQQDFVDPRNSTHILDLSTLVWSTGPTGTTTNPQPTAQFPNARLDYDAVRKRMLWNATNHDVAVGSGFAHDVWELQHPTADDLIIPNQTFVARGMLGVEIGRSPWMWGFGLEIGKHVVWLNDKKRKRIVSVGGDFRGLWWHVHGAISANVESFTYDAKNDLWENLSPSSTGPGTVVPCRPNDGQPTVHDTRRDRYWAIDGGWALPSGAGPHLHGQVVNQMDFTQGQNLGGFFYQGKTSVSGSTLWNGLMWMNPDTGIWTGVTNSSIGSPLAVEAGLIVNSYHSGIYDPVQDCITSLEGQASVIYCRVFLNDNPALITMSRVTINVSAMTVTGVFPKAMQLQQPCFDILGRKCYAMCLAVDNNDDSISHGQRLIRFDLDNPSAPAELLATPPFQSTSRDPSGTGGSFRILFDTKNRRVLYPVSQTPEGIVVGMASYNPATNAWTTHPLTVSPSSSFGPPVGNSVIYDETHNCVVLGGSGGEIPEEQGYFYLWRYA